MLDMLGLSHDFRGDIQVFRHPNYNSVLNVTPYTWRRPSGCAMAMFIAISGGAGGGGGHSAGAGNARGGGGGGGSSGWAKVIVPLILLPDVLHLLVGIGGAGGTATNDGTIGSNSHVVTSSLCITTGAVVDYLLSSNSSQPAAGLKGTGAAAGTGGQAGLISTIGGAANRSGLGIFLALAGQIGANGGVQTGAVGGSITIPTTGTFSQAGAGGAGVTAADFAGGTFTPITDSYISQQLPAAHAAGSVDGPGGNRIIKPFFALGGGGGSSSNNGVGGNGGDGGWPGGGGGGGGGGTTGGTGGRGGDGAIIVVSW